MLGKVHPCCTRAKGRPRRYLATITNSWGRRCSPRAVLGTTFNQSPAWHLRPSLLVSVLDMSRPPTNCQKTPTNLMVAFSGANSYSGSPNGEWIKHWSQGIKTGMNELKDDAKCDSDVLVNKHVLQ